MKFRCERDILSEGLGNTARAASRSGALTVLSGIKVSLNGDKLTLVGSDLDLTIIETITVNGDDDGDVVIPAKLIVEIVKLLPPGAVTVETNNGEVKISGGRSAFSLNLISGEEFPTPNSVEGEQVTVDAQEFVVGLKQVIPAASTDDSRPILTGVLVAAEGSGIRLVSTDSYRLAVRDLPGTNLLETDELVLVPSRALQEVARIVGNAEDLELQLSDKHARFELGEISITTRLIDGDFPNYRGLIPDSHPNVMTIDRKSFVDAVKRVKLMAREATPVRLTMSDGQVELVATTQDVGQATELLDCAYVGEELMVAFNPDYLLTGLEVSLGDEVTLHTVDSLKPALLKTADNPNFLYLLMPVRVS